MRFIHLGTALMFFAGNACADPPPTESAATALASSRDAVRFTNRSSEPVYYIVFEREFATLVDWIPCVDPAVCPSAAPGRTATIPVKQIWGYESGDRQAIVYWWRLVRGENGRFAARDLRSEIVDIR